MKSKLLSTKGEWFGLGIMVGALIVGAMHWVLS